MDSALTESKQADKGTTVTASPVTKDGFVFDASNANNVNGIELTEDDAVLKLYYNRITVTIAYDKNSPTATGSMEGAETRYGNTVVAAENAFYDSDNLFVGWNTDRHGIGQSYAPGDRVLLNASLTLYAQWQVTYRCDDESVTDRIYLTDETGLGSAVLLRGGETKKGFYDADKREAEFFFDGGNLFARLDGESMRFRYRDDSVVGIYEYFDYTHNKTLPGVAMNFDGYGFATYSLPDGTGMLASYGGTCEQTDAGDYLFTITIGPDSSSIGATIYVMLDRYATPTENVVGRFMQQGYEYGARFLYGNGDLGNDQLQIDGYGNAVYLTGYRVDTEKYDREIAGKYLAVTDNDDWHGEYEFTSEDGETAFRFIVLDFAINNNAVYVFMRFNETQQGVYTCADLAGVRLELDGYDGAIYSNGDTTTQGIVQDDGNRNLTVSLLDESGAIKGVMTVRVDYETKTFVEYSDGIIYEDEARTVVSAYTGNNTAVVIPEGVVKVNAEVFKNAALTALTLPATLAEIGDYAFQNDHTLTVVRIAAPTPPTLGTAAFRWPNGGLQIIVPDGREETYRTAAGWSEYAEYITSEAELANRPEFEVKNGVLVRYTCKVENPVDLDIAIPDGVTAIAARVFANRDYIRSVDLNGVTTLGDSAFDSCVNLSQVTGAMLETIGAFAFFGCEKLVEVDFAAAITVGNKAFADCYLLKTARLGTNLTAIGDFAFEYTGYEDETTGTLGLFRLILDGETPPTMGVKVFGFTPTRIIVKNIDAALDYLTANTWSAYATHLMAEAGDEAGQYFCTTDQSIDMILNGRAEFDGFYLFLYRIENNVVTYYYYDKETAELRIFNGTYDAATRYLTLTLGNEVYAFYPEGKELTYTNEDEGELTLNNGSGKVTFRGVEYEVKLGQGNFVFSDGKTDYTVTLYGDMTYSVVRKPTTTVLTYTAADGGEVTITSGSYIFGTFRNITVDGVVILEQSYCVGTETADGFDFTVQYRSQKYTVHVVVDETAKTFVYTWEKQ